MVAKGHLPGYELAAVNDADLGPKVPDFRAEGGHSSS
jgi:primosomal protein N'